MSRSSEYPTTAPPTEAVTFDEKDEEEAQADPPDSHEAMHNRAMPGRTRNKREFEFLLGLINNNSRYEVTRVDPELKEKKTTPQNFQASNLLLELIVKIAKHPDQWNKVHQLLQNIDKDLMTSRHFVEQYSQRAPDVPAPTRAAATTPAVSAAAVSAAATSAAERPEKRERFAGGGPYEGNRWPAFGGKPKSAETPPSATAAKLADGRTAYAKNFAYHRVTGKPAYLKKNPTAYIAVSVIQPKRVDEEDLLLENELRKLKPWGHRTVDSWSVQKKTEDDSRIKISAL